MKLTRKKALEICIELWTWLAETGRRKVDWGRWEEYGEFRAYCPFCEYYAEQRHGGCRACPINFCLTNQAFLDWCDAGPKRTRKKYAKIFLEKIRE